MKPCSILIGALLLTAAPVALAKPAIQSSGNSAMHASCMDNSGGVTSTMLDCMSRETALHDLRLNSAYRAALSSLGGENVRRLRIAQRTWIKFRDAECGLHGRLTGGSIDRLNGGACAGHDPGTGQSAATTERAAGLTAAPCNGRRCAP